MPYNQGLCFYLYYEIGEMWMEAYLVHGSTLISCNSIPFKVLFVLAVQKAASNYTEFFRTITE